MNAFIIYNGKYGATHQYAKWLSSALHFPIFRTDEVEGKNLANHDSLIIGGSVYTGTWQAAAWLRENLNHVRNMKIIIFIVCATPPENKDKLEEIARQNIPAEIKNRSSIYFLHGRMVLKNLSWKHRLMMKLGAALTRDPVQKARMLQDFDDVKKENLQPMINEILKYQNQSKVKANSPEPVATQL
jgi:menaquinone-dependent protoporphyrinogen IX oxidase